MAYRSSSNNSGASTTPTVAVPTGAAAGDIMILVLDTDGGGDVIEQADFPSGFTRLYDSSVTTDEQSTGIGWKRLTGADTGTYAFGVVGTSNEWLCQAYCFSGRSASSDPVATENIVNTSGASPRTISATGVTAVAGDDLLWISAPDVTVLNAGNGHTAPSGYTERQDAENLWVNMSGATKDNDAGGATGTVSGTFTMTSGNCGYVAYLVRIPVASGSPANTTNFFRFF